MTYWPSPRELFQHYWLVVLNALSAFFSNLSERLDVRLRRGVERHDWCPLCAPPSVKEAGLSYLPKEAFLDSDPSRMRVVTDTHLRRVVVRPGKVTSMFHLARLLKRRP
jgi:hypothetical protein